MNRYEEAKYQAETLEHKLKKRKKLSRADLETLKLAKEILKEYKGLHS